MNLEDVAAYLEKKKVGKQGLDIFAHEMPVETTEGVLLRDRYSGTPVDPEMPGYFDTGFRAAVRSRDFTRGKALANLVQKTLTIDGEDVQMGSLLVKQMQPAYLPRPFRRTRGNYWEWELEIDVVFVA